jgi:hypothetical protein
MSTFVEVSKVRNKEHFYGPRDAWFYYRLMASRDISKKNFLAFYKLYFQHLGDRSQFKILNFDPIAVIPLSSSVVIEKVRLYNRIENTFLNREVFVPENEANTVAEFLALNQDENLDFEHRVSSNKLEIRNGFTEYEDELVSPTQSEIDAELCNPAASFHDDDLFNPRPIDNYSMSSMLEDTEIVSNFVKFLLKILFFF